MATVLNKLNLFFKNLYIDYYEVFKDVQKGAKAKPLKALSYGASTLFVLNLFRTNEGLRSYSSEVVGACNRVASVNQNSRNPESYKFVQNIGEWNCHGLLRQIDLGFSTIIYKADCNPEVALFRYNCSHLKPSLKEFFKERLVDLGILGHWVLLEAKMQNYDINDSEYNITSTSESI